MKTTYTFNQEEMEKMILAMAKLSIGGIKPNFRWNVQENTDMRGEKIGNSVTLAIEVDYMPTQQEFERFESGPFPR